MDPLDSELARQSEFVAVAVDPLVRQVLAADDPQDAYLAATQVPAALQRGMDLPNGGGMYVAWSGLTDVFETGRTPDDDAHEALRRSAESWLDRRDPVSAAFFEDWRQFAAGEVRRLYSRDGNFWTVGYVAGRPFWVTRGARVDVVLGDGLPVLQDALRDAIASRAIAGRRGRDLPYWIDEAITGLHARIDDGSDRPFAHGRWSTLTVVDRVVQARYRRDPRATERVDNAPARDVLALLLAWKEAARGVPVGRGVSRCSDAPGWPRVS